MKNKLFAKIVAGLLAVLMVVGLLPLIASADESDASVAETGDKSLDNLVVHKTARLEDDGTYTITLEAYAKGQVEATVTRQVLPTDIIMVLDQSGSMVDDDMKITVPGSSYTVASNVTNKTLADNPGVYYYYDNNDKTYYPVTATKQIVEKNTYWTGTNTDGSSIKILESAADGQVGTSWSAGNNTYNFDTGDGYLLSNYMIFQRERSSGQYTYRLINQNGTAVSNGETTDGAYNRAGAREELEAAYGDYSFDYTGSSYSTNYGAYALAYVPLTLTEEDVYYYTYTYVDKYDQLWTIGHSEQDDGAGEHIDGEYYDSAALGNIYTRGTAEVTRLLALQSAAYQFIDAIKEATVAHNVDHRIAVVGFSGSGRDSNGEMDSDDDNYEKYYYVNSELFIGAQEYNAAAGGKDSDYNTDGSLAEDKYGEAFQSVNTENGYNNLYASIGALAGNGPTFPEAGMDIAVGLSDFETHAAAYKAGTRKLVVVFMTDGFPGWNYTGEYNIDSTSVSAATADAAYLETTYGAKVYSLALLDQALTNGSTADQFLKNMATDGTYSLATSGMDLSNFFYSVETSVDNTTALVDLTEDAYVVDRVSEYFQIPEGFSASNVKVYTAPHQGDEEFGTPVEMTFAYNDNTADGLAVWPTYGESDGLIHGITVHNFNFISDENLVTTTTTNVGEGGETDNAKVATGNKLIITISGVLAKDNAAQNAYVETNNSHSGIWDTVKDSENVYGMLKAFPMPTKYLANRTYVLDYAKESMLDTTSSIRNALALDSAKDGLFSKLGYSVVTDDQTTSNAYYTTTLTTEDTSAVQFGDVRISPIDKKVYYNPKTTNWSGYDSFYVFWNASETSEDNPGFGDPVTGNGWSKVNVVPANNVYYEDTFVSTTESDGTGADTTAEGVVGIVYSGEWFTDTSGSNVGENVEHPENLENQDQANHGWEDSLADDTGYSDGSAHGANFAKDENGRATAKATFTFTGSGMDIYSRTNTKTGTILVEVKPDEATANNGAKTKYFVVDTLAASNGEDGYYQIPVVSYSGIHGTYAVTITVTGAADFEEYGNRKLFYLDGIRIYNPLSNEQENDPIVDEGYDTAVDSLFMELRDKLLDANTFNAQSPAAAGAVFIDQINEGDLTSEAPAEGETATEGEEAAAAEDTTTEAGTPTTTTVIGTYEDFGPKNEVYLAKGQSVVFKVNSTEHTLYFVGLKVPTGAATNVLVSNGDSNAAITVGHTTDLFYRIVPNGGAYVQITNNGDSLLAVTKLKKVYTDDEAPEAQDDSGIELQAISADEALLYAARSAQMPVVPYVVPESTTDTPETDTPNVEITLPTQPSVEELIKEQIEKLVSELFGSVTAWFNF